MASNPPIPSAPEQRILAAIVFTDVAGFTARVQLEESATLKLLERDFAAMRDFSAEFSGTVLKTTGDGLLLYFTSAVHAVSWALRTQRHFAAEAKIKAAPEMLHHRVGVHLGDVSLKGGDVMGDGVNVAARVQSEAPPGGICISQMVYDVVRNKMELHVIRLEPRRLKNVRENVQMYHVLLEEPVRPPVSPPRPLGAEKYKTARDSAPSKSRRLTAAVLALVAITATAGLIVRTHFEQEKELAASKQNQEALSAALGGRPAATAVENKPVRQSPPVSTELQFAKLAIDRPPNAPKDEAAVREAAVCVKDLEGWLDGELKRYSRDRPLVVRRLGRLSSNLNVFTNSGQLHLTEGGITLTRTWHEISREWQAAIVASAVLADVGNPPPRKVVRGAEAFAYLHGLPDLANALLNPRRLESVQR